MCTDDIAILMTSIYVRIFGANAGLAYDIIVDDAMQLKQNDIRHYSLNPLKLLEFAEDGAKLLLVLN